eukprot:gene33353-11142_t
MEGIQTEVTRMLKIQHPIFLAGMFGVAHHDLAAAVSNAGGLGTIGGLTMKPDMLRKEIGLLKGLLNDKTAFGVDLAFPQIGGSARKTNHDYTEGHFPELIDIICDMMPWIRCVDLICAQGTEAGGQQGGARSHVGVSPKGCYAGITHLAEGRGVAAALALGAQAAVWVGTRFVASKESTGSKVHKANLIKAQSMDT